MPTTVLISGPVVIFGSTSNQQVGTLEPTYVWFPVGVSENGVRITVNTSIEEVTTDASGDVPHDILVMGGNATITATVRLFDDNANILVGGNKLISRVLGIPEFAEASNDTSTTLDTLAVNSAWINAMGMSVKHQVPSGQTIGFSLAVLSLYQAVAPIKGYIFPTVVCEGTKDIQLNQLSVVATWRTVPRWTMQSGVGNLLFMKPITDAAGFPAVTLAVS